VRLGPSTWAIVEEARRRGIPVRRLNSRSLVQLGLGRNLRRIQARREEVADMDVGPAGRPERYFPGGSDPEYHFHFIGLRTLLVLFPWKN